ncbi:MAG: hypothetical protein GX868_03200 [Actinobacteria bacterium]|nr:hypothetical protein [Actinomycetota bacterium]
MTSPNAPKPTGWFTGHTRLITVVSILAVGLAGATAVSANLGILQTASDSPVGNASATGDLTAPTQVIDVVMPDTVADAATASAAPGTDPAVQQFAVDVAGTVSVIATNAGLKLDEVIPAAGWSWSLAQSDPMALVVTMTNGSRTFEFTASTTGDGNIAASVNEPIVAVASAARSGGDDDRDDRDDDHDERDDRDDKFEKYEGGDDDD